MTEMRQSEAKESEVNHRFVEHAQWYDIQQPEVVVMLSQHAQCLCPSPLLQGILCMRKPALDRASVFMSLCAWQFEQGSNWLERSTNAYMRNGAIVHQDVDIA